MKQKLDVAFEVNQVKIRIIRGNITQISADALVSSDDVFLSRGGGVSLALSRAAGDPLNDDISKVSIPLTLGSVLVTSAGRLPAKYVFHATTIDFSTRPLMPALIAHLIRRILKIAVALEVNHIALPLVGTGYGKFSPKQGLACIFESTAYYLADKSFPGIEQISIVIFGSPGIQPTINELKKKMHKAERIQQRISRFRGICTEMPEDKELNEILSIRVSEAMRELRQLFYFEGIDSSQDFSQGEKLQGKDEFEEAKSRLEQALDQVHQQISSKQKLSEIHQRRLQKRKEEQAMRGISAPPEIVIEIEDIEEWIKKLKHELSQLQNQYSMYQRELNTLNHKIA